MAFNLNKKITLNLLSTLEEDGDMTQRNIASKLGVALGLANAYLKKSVEKGYVKIKQVPRKRYSYYITPKGFAEKAALTAEYFTSSYAFFRKSKNDCELILNECALNGIYDVILSNISELAEITILTSLDSKINIIGVIDEDKTSFNGVNVYKNFSDIKKYDGIILTEVNKPQERYDYLSNNFPSHKIFSPAVLNIRKKNE